MEDNKDTKNLIDEEAPKGFLNQKSKPVKNIKAHYHYLKKKTYNKTNAATDQKELPKFNQIGEATDPNVPIVYFTKKITPSSLKEIYHKLGVSLKGNVGVKISTGEPGGHNYLKPELIKDLVSEIRGTIIETNTAYKGKRSDSKSHWKAIKDHGFTDIAKCDIMDEEGEAAIRIDGKSYHLHENLVGTHIESYDSILILSHFKGHAMAGFGGALKNMSIGMASANGKVKIHTGGKGEKFEDCSNTPQNVFLESMADADKSIMQYFGEDNIVYINIANNLSVDCDCDAHPHKPEMKDIGIFASTDPVALDQACIDAVFNSNDKGKRSLINRINSRNGLHILDAASELDLGSKKYNLVSIDTLKESSNIEPKKRLSLREIADGVDVRPIYLVTSYTHTPFGRVITTYTKAKYSHAAISFDSSLENLYSFNADNHTNRLGGISMESISSYVDYYENASILVNCIFVKKSDFDIIKNALDNLVKGQKDTRYGYTNIFNIILGRAKETTDDALSMVCSQFVSYILHKADIKLVDKPDNLVTPKDLSTINNPRVYKVYEGYARLYDKKKTDRLFRILKTKALLIKESLLKLCV